MTHVYVFLVEFIYPDFLCNMINLVSFFLWWNTRSIEQVNDLILSLIFGEEETYLNLDTLCQYDENQ